MAKLSIDSLQPLIETSDIIQNQNDEYENGWEDYASSLESSANSSRSQTPIPREP